MIKLIGSLANLAKPGKPRTKLTLRETWRFGVSCDGRCKGKVSVREST
jgi:hypothetical protein